MDKNADMDKSGPFAIAPGAALCIDLDGTLLRTDLLHESIISLLARNPLFLLLMPFWLLRGRAAFKRQIASRVSLDPESLPYDERVIELVRSSRARPRVLCTASDEAAARQIANYLGLFERVIGSDGHQNLSGRRKAEALTREYGNRGFHYAGNAHVDLHVWEYARGGWVVNGSSNLAGAASRRCEIYEFWPGPSKSIKTWLQAIRLHQWLKNLLVFVPLLAGHLFLKPVALSDAVMAFVAFGLCASGVYVLNDLLDLPADRKHPRKKFRPFASAKLPLLHGVLVAPILALCGFGLAYWCSPTFALVLGAYYLMTLSYSLKLKRITMIDVVLLAGLYTVRIIGGAAAIGAPLSFWLLAFSMFLFLSLALVKRYTELVTMLGTGKTNAHGRGYTVDDIPLIQSLGAAAGYICVLVLAFYINSPESFALYHRPQVLWLLCPVLLYWVSRVWMVAHRGAMNDDPVIFAVTDRVSQLVIALCGLILLWAI